MYTRAITRRPGPDCALGITASNLGPPDYALLSEQHNAYVEALRSAGLDVTVLDPLPGHPDAYFVEDTAVVTSGVAVITNPGAESRKGEVDTIESVLAPFRETIRIQGPGTVDGGDVLQIGSHFLIGISGRTDEAGARQLGGILERNGYTWTAVTVDDVLHLKASVNYVGRSTLLVSEHVAHREELREYEKIVVDRDEEYAANTLFVNDCIILPAGYPSTRKKLERLGCRIVELDVSEARKMDGGLTCMSIRF
ncbi:MAG: amidinotransferase [bacterium]|nr:MAG: amidinotransferase [bacterium]